ncbi:MAG: hypothetical protein HS104_09605 [Polyangiaceae bacterium]|nr:hypothetical protein [Polyangiaceae bacterium]MCE7890760.1 hypothetical protein [Sorangiineae bacterium PRO1]MCL4754342.1 hypothetical protein [Myxococcales bacterium]
MSKAQRKTSNDRRATHRSNARAFASLDRRAKAVELRLAGASYRRIATQLGVNVSNAFRLVQRALADAHRLVREDADRLVQLELMRMDRCVQKLERGLNSRDDETVARAVRELVRVSASRRRLLGLDQPAQLHVAGVPTAGVFIGWSDEDLERFVKTGEHPDRRLPPQAILLPKLEELDQADNQGTEKP